MLDQASAARLAERGVHLLACRQPLQRPHPLRKMRSCPAAPAQPASAFRQKVTAHATCPRSRPNTGPAHVCWQTASAAQHAAPAGPSLKHSHRCGRRVRVLGARHRPDGRVLDDCLPRACTQRSHAPDRAGTCGALAEPCIWPTQSPGDRLTGHAGTCGGGLWSSSTCSQGVTSCSSRRALSCVRRCAARLGVDADDGGHLAQRGLVGAQRGQARVQRAGADLLEHAAQRARLVVVRAV